MTETKREREGKRQRETERQRERERERQRKRGFLLEARLRKLITAKEVFKTLLKIENTCVRVYFLKKLSPEELQLY